VTFLHQSMSHHKTDVRRSDLVFPSVWWGYIDLFTSIVYFCLYAYVIVHCVSKKHPRRF